MYIQHVKKQRHPFCVTAAPNAVYENKIPTKHRKGSNSAPPRKRYTLKWNIVAD
eukprot:TRINITY_DN16098_c0_g1_i1.p2 TRINITY_DN16098_c0_g1~~TRINITY_DN16098_c0_g1_i1.p2  ORF type:complete len:54 (+),score=8.96 TRINITY_DN16098_c0_g1_i1:398-559(+)